MSGSESSTPPPPSAETAPAEAPSQPTAAAVATEEKPTETAPPTSEPAPEAPPPDTTDKAEVEAEPKKDEGGLEEPEPDAQQPAEGTSAQDIPNDTGTKGNDDATPDAPEQPPPATTEETPANTDTAPKPVSEPIKDDEPTKAAAPADSGSTEDATPAPPADADGESEADTPNAEPTAVETPKPVESDSAGENSQTADDEPPAAQEQQTEIPVDDAKPQEGAEAAVGPENTGPASEEVKEGEEVVAAEPSPEDDPSPGSPPPPPEAVEEQKQESHEAENQTKAETPEAAEPESVNEEMSLPPSQEEPEKCPPTASDEATPDPPVDAPSPPPPPPEVPKDTDPPSPEEASEEPADSSAAVGEETPTADLQVVSQEPELKVDDAPQDSETVESNPQVEADGGDSETKNDSAELSEAKEEEAVAADQPSDPEPAQPKETAPQPDGNESPAPATGQPVEPTETLAETPSTETAVSEQAPQPTTDADESAPQDQPKETVSELPSEPKSTEDDPTTDSAEVEAKPDDISPTSEDVKPTDKAAVEENEAKPQQSESEDAKGESVAEPSEVVAATAADAEASGSSPPSADTDVEATVKPESADDTPAEDNIPEPVEAETIEQPSAEEPATETVAEATSTSTEDESKHKDSQALEESEEVVSTEDKPADTPTDSPAEQPVSEPAAEESPAVPATDETPGEETSRTEQAEELQGVGDTASSPVDEPDNTPAAAVADDAPEDKETEVTPTKDDEPANAAESKSPPSKDDDHSGNTESAAAPDVSEDSGSVANEASEDNKEPVQEAPPEPSPPEAEPAADNSKTADDIADNSAAEVVAKELEDAEQTVSIVEDTKSLGTPEPEKEPDSTPEMASKTEADSASVATAAAGDGDADGNKDADAGESKTSEADMPPEPVESAPPAPVDDPTPSSIAEAALAVEKAPDSTDAPDIAKFDDSKPADEDEKVHESNIEETAPAPASASSPAPDTTKEPLAEIEATGPPQEQAEEPVEGATAEAVADVEAAANGDVNDINAEPTDSPASNPEAETEHPTAKTDPQDATEDSAGADAALASQDKLDADASPSGDNNEEKLTDISKPDDAKAALSTVVAPEESTPAVDLVPGEPTEDGAAPEELVAVAPETAPVSIPAPEVAEQAEAVTENADAVPEPEKAVDSVASASEDVQAPAPTEKEKDSKDASAAAAPSTSAEKALPEDTPAPPGEDASPPAETPAPAEEVAKPDAIEPEALESGSGPKEAAAEAPSQPALKDTASENENSKSEDVPSEDKTADVLQEEKTADVTEDAESAKDAPNPATEGGAKAAEEASAAEVSAAGISPANVSEPQSDGMVISKVDEEPQPSEDVTRAEDIKETSDTSPDLVPTTTEDDDIKDASHTTTLEAVKETAEVPLSKPVDDAGPAPASDGGGPNTTDQATEPAIDYEEPKAEAEAGDTPEPESIDSSSAEVVPPSEDPVSLDGSAEHVAKPESEASPAPAVTEGATNPEEKEETATIDSAKDVVAAPVEATAAESNDSELASPEKVEADIATATEEAKELEAQPDTEPTTESATDPTVNVEPTQEEVMPASATKNHAEEATTSEIPKDEPTEILVLAVAHEPIAESKSSTDAEDGDVASTPKSEPAEDLQEHAAPAGVADEEPPVTLVEDKSEPEAHASAEAAVEPTKATTPDTEAAVIEASKEDTPEAISSSAPEEQATATPAEEREVATQPEPAQTKDGAPALVGGSSHKAAVEPEAVEIGDAAASAETEPVNEARPETIIEVNEVEAKGVLASEAQDEDGSPPVEALASVEEPESSAQPTSARPEEAPTVAEFEPEPEPSKGAELDGAQPDVIKGVLPEDTKQALSGVIAEAPSAPAEPEPPKDGPVSSEEMSAPAPAELTEREPANESPATETTLPGDSPEIGAPKLVVAAAGQPLEDQVVDHPVEEQKSLQEEPTVPTKERILEPTPIEAKSVTFENTAENKDDNGPKDEVGPMPSNKAAEKASKGEIQSPPSLPGDAPGVFEHDFGVERTPEPVPEPVFLGEGMGEDVLQSERSPQFKDVCEPGTVEEPSETSEISEVHQRRSVKLEDEGISEVASERLGDDKALTGHSTSALPIDSESSPLQLPRDNESHPEMPRSPAISESFLSEQPTPEDDNILGSPVDPYEGIPVQEITQGEIVEEVPAPTWPPPSLPHIQEKSIESPSACSMHRAVPPIVDSSHALGSALERVESANNVRIRLDVPENILSSRADSPRHLAEPDEDQSPDSAQTLAQNIEQHQSVFTKESRDEGAKARRIPDIAAQSSAPVDSPSDTEDKSPIVSLGDSTFSTHTGPSALPNETDSSGAAPGIPAVASDSPPTGRSIMHDILLGTYTPLSKDQPKAEIVSSSTPPGSPNMVAIESIFNDDGKTPVLSATPSATKIDRRSGEAASRTRSEVELLDDFFLVEKPDVPNDQADEMERANRAHHQTLVGAQDQPGQPNLKAPTLTLTSDTTSDTPSTREADQDAPKGSLVSRGEDRHITTPKSSAILSVTESSDLSSRRPVSFEGDKKTPAKEVGTKDNPITLEPVPSYNTSIAEEPPSVPVSKSPENQHHVSANAGQVSAHLASGFGHHVASLLSMKSVPEAKTPKYPDQESPVLRPLGTPSNGLVDIPLSLDDTSKHADGICPPADGLSREPFHLESRGEPDAARDTPSKTSILPSREPKRIGDHENEERSQRKNLLRELTDVFAGRNGGIGESSPVSKQPPEDESRTDMTLPESRGIEGILAQLESDRLNSPLSVESPLSESGFATVSNVPLSESFTLVEKEPIPEKSSKRTKRVHLISSGTQTEEEGFFAPNFGPRSPSFDISQLEPRSTTPAVVLPDLADSKAMELGRVRSVKKHRRMTLRKAEDTLAAAVIIYAATQQFDHETSPTVPSSGNSDAGQQTEAIYEHRRTVQEPNRTLIRDLPNDHDAYKREVSRSAADVSTDDEARSSRSHHSDRSRRRRHHHHHSSASRDDTRNNEHSHRHHRRSSRAESDNSLKSTSDRYQSRPLRRKDSGLASEGSRGSSKKQRVPDERELLQKERELLEKERELREMERRLKREKDDREKQREAKSKEAERPPSDKRPHRSSGSQSHTSRRQSIKEDAPVALPLSKKFFDFNIKNAESVLAPNYTTPPKNDEAPEEPETIVTPEEVLQPSPEPPKRNNTRRSHRRSEDVSQSKPKPEDPSLSRRYRRSEDVSQSKNYRLDSGPQPSHRRSEDAPRTRHHISENIPQSRRHRTEDGTPPRHRESQEISPAKHHRSRDHRESRDDGSPKRHRRSSRVDAVKPEVPKPRFSLDADSPSPPPPKTTAPESREERHLRREERQRARAEAEASNKKPANGIRAKLKKIFA